MKMTRVCLHHFSLGHTPVTSHSTVQFYLNWFVFDLCGILYMKPLAPEAGGRLNKKDGLTRYGDSHVKDKTS